MSQIEQRVYAHIATEAGNSIASALVTIGTLEAKEDAYTARIQQLEQQNADLTNERDQLKKDKGAMSDKLGALQPQVALLQAQVQTLKKEGDLNGDKHRDSAVAVLPNRNHSKSKHGKPRTK